MMIISCGETLIDMIPIQGANGEQGFQPLVGGALFNTAIGLGRLGAEVAMISGISNDLFGQQLAQALAASHVQTNLLVRSDLPTTLAFVRLNNGHADYTFYDENFKPVLDIKLFSSKLTDKSMNYFLFHNSFVVI